MAPDKYPLEPLFGRILSPFERFLRSTAAGGILLIVATAVALALGATLGDAALHDFWDQTAGFDFEDQPILHLTLHHWVNDGLMALFFLLVGLEIKREVLIGELASLRDAALPVFGALGGMVAPAAIYAALNVGTPTASGWGIPMATDIAFAVGILVLLTWRVPRNLIVFLTALAIADDLGAVLVIAVFYTASLDMKALGAVAGILAALALLNRGGVRHLLPYSLLGLLLWYAMLRSGIHATVAGILLAFSIPARPSEGSDQSPLQVLEHRLSPYVATLVVPVFALANAGIDLGAIEWSSALSRRETLGIVLGLAIGKFAGISLLCWLAVRTGMARLPAGVEWRHLLGASWLAGIGFTMSLFIAQLAFTDPRMVDSAKLGILLASAISATAGLVWLVASARKP